MKHLLSDNANKSRLYFRIVLLFPICQTPGRGLEESVDSNNEKQMSSSASHQQSPGAESFLQNYDYNYDYGSNTPGTPWLSNCLVPVAVVASFRRIYAGE